MDHEMDVGSEPETGSCSAALGIPPILLAYYVDLSAHHLAQARSDRCESARLYLRDPARPTGADHLLPVERGLDDPVHQLAVAVRRCKEVAVRPSTGWTGDEAIRDDRMGREGTYAAAAANDGRGLLTRRSSPSSVERRF